MTTLALHRPEEIVAVGAGAPRTAADLDADARRIADALADLAPGEVIVVCGDPYLYTAALHGAWAAGHGVLLPPNVQPQTIEAVMADPAARVLLHDRDGAPGGIDVRALLRSPSPAGALALPPPEQLRLTFMTSGSTGAHQRWPKDARQLLAETDRCVDLFPMRPGERVLSTVPPQHRYGMQYGVLLALRARAALVRAEALHAEAVAAELARHGASWLVSVPAHLTALAAHDRAPPGMNVFSAGAPLPARTAGALRDRFGWGIFELYGATEVGAIAWREESEEWTPFPGAVVTADGEGSLEVDVPWLDAGGPRPFPVPDRIELRPGGRFLLLGRRDGVVKVAGKRVALREVEERLLSVPGVRDAAALAQPSSGLRGEEIWVAVAADGLAPERVREALAAWFDPVALPRRIRIVETLPREATGKIRRERLLALFEGPGQPARLEPEGEEKLAAGAGRDGRRLSFTVSEDLRWFQGHFPGDPVLPGVAQLDGLVARQVERLWPDAGIVRAVKRLKFSRVIRPGDRIALELTRDQARGTVAFTIDGPGGRCASGTLVLETGEGS